MINCLIAFNSTQIDNFLDNFRFDMTDPDAAVRLRTDFAKFTDAEGVTLNPYNRQHLYVNMQANGMWRPRDEAGPATTIIVSMYVADITYPDPDDGKPKLSMVDYLREFFDGRYQVMGAWENDGVLYGQTLVPATYDENGKELTPRSIEGNATYPLNPNYLDWMPDDVTYDLETGAETSRTSAVEFKQVNKLQGHLDRRV